MPMEPAEAAPRGRAPHPGRPASRRAVLLIAAVGAVLTGTGPVPLPAAAADAPDAPDIGGPATRITPEEIVRRAQSWVDRKVPYSMTALWSDGYRQDCSGFVSMAWALGRNETTWSLPHLADRITGSELRPGDVLIHNDPAHAVDGSHAVIFAGWLDSGRTRYVGYEQTWPHTAKRSVPYPYWHHTEADFLPYRYRGSAVRAGDAGAAAP